MGLRRALVHAAVVLAALAPILAGCGGGSSTANEFGPPPSPAAGVHAWAVGEAGDVLFTGDGGASWQRRAFGLPARAIDVVFADARHGWLVGFYQIWATSDGGETWRLQRVDLPEPASGDLQLEQVTCAGELSLWATCDAGVIASADGGRTWVLQKVPGGAASLCIAAADGQHVLATTNGQPILATSDGGDTWRAFGKAGYLEQSLGGISAVTAADAE